MTKTTRLKVLLVNDDGINADGISALVNALKPVAFLTVVAPSYENSAKSHSLTTKTPIECRKNTKFEGVEAYEIAGTPADCVKFALKRLELQCDVIVSGINHGRNLATDVLYSGTVSAAFEGAVNGVKGVAVSCALFDSAALNFAAEFIAENLLKLVEACDCGNVLNVNFPKCSNGEIKGVRVAKQGKVFYDDVYREVNDGTGYSYRLVGTSIEQSSDGDNDFAFSLKNYITITPLQIDRTDYLVLKRIKEKFECG